MSRVINILINKVTFQVLTIALAGFLVYSNSLNVPFFFDDIQVIDTASSGYSYDWFGDNRYVANLTFALNYKLHGEDVRGYHITNIAIHIVNAMLVYLLVIYLRRAGGLRYGNNSSTATGNPNRLFKHEVAFFTALLFVVHPLQHQAVTLVVQRYTSLATLFYLLTILLYLKWRFLTDKTFKSKEQYLHGGKTASTGRLKGVSFYMTAVVTAYLASITKQIVITLPVTITMIEFMLFSGKPLKRLLWCVPFYFMIPYILNFNLGYDIPIISATMGNLSYDSGHVLTRRQYLFTEFRVIITYIRMLLFPVNLTLVYDYPIYSSFWQPDVYISFIVLSLIFILGIYLFYRANGSSNTSGKGMALISLGILWFFVVISPQSSIVPILDWVILEYRVYMASVGFFVVIVVGVFMASDVVGAKRVRIALTIALLVVSAVFGAGTYRRNAICQSAITAYEDNVMKSPHTFVRISLAAAYARKGLYDKAAETLSYILTYEPDNPEVHARLGFVYYRQGRPDDAIGQYKAAVAIKGNYADAYNNLGTIYMEQGRFNEAVEAFRAAVKYRHNIAGHVNLGDIYLRQGRPEEAMNQYLYALDVGKGNPKIHTVHYRLGRLYEGLGNLEKAADQYATAIRLNPGYAEAYNNLGVVLGKQGRIGDACDAIKKAVDLRPDYADAHNNLGICLKLQGKAEQAKQQFKIAIDLDPGHRNAQDNLKAMP
ncbi:MAG: tetratricopeptide repeat protein [Nitrospirae bacterium]|uniref:tetratricopeptide repeat protein n=1 Tax=Candidatus Magnetobacterium casense TaxID=1455061 RepID=UPI00058E07C8|nr:tetratricopeptide repeat protein [Candidatus Magnetobacterium casensis]MBF0337407.1 tetratricopeptide repeat protein [Nitrospirota bacterium]